MRDQEAFLSLPPLPPPRPERYYARGYERSRNAELARDVCSLGEREEAPFGGEFADVAGSRTALFFFLI